MSYIFDLLASRECRLKILGIIFPKKGELACYINILNQNHLLYENNML